MTKEPAHSLGKRIRAMRQLRNLTQKQLADMAGLTYPQISLYETQVPVGSYVTIKKIAKALGTTAIYLMEGSES